MSSEALDAAISSWQVFPVVSLDESPYVDDTEAYRRRLKADSKRLFSESQVNVERLCRKQGGP
jgi:hypothetical protein